MIVPTLLEIDVEALQPRCRIMHMLGPINLKMRVKQQINCTATPRPATACVGLANPACPKSGDAAHSGRKLIKLHGTAYRLPQLAGYGVRLGRPRLHDRLNSNRFSALRKRVGPGGGPRALPLLSKQGM